MCCSVVETLAGCAPGDALALDKFNQSWTELNNWLSLLDHMVLTQRVTVGDLGEISDLTAKLKVSAVYGVSGVMNVMRSYRY